MWLAPSYVPSTSIPAIWYYKNENGFLNAHMGISAERGFKRIRCKRWYVHSAKLAPVVTLHGYGHEYLVDVGCIKEPGAWNTPSCIGSPISFSSIHISRWISWYDFDRLQFVLNPCFPENISSVLFWNSSHFEWKLCRLLLILGYSLICH